MLFDLVTRLGRAGLTSVAARARNGPSLPSLCVGVRHSGHPSLLFLSFQTNSSLVASATNCSGGCGLLEAGPHGALTLTE